MSRRPQAIRDTTGAGPPYGFYPQPILRNLTFESLPYETHPIDIYHGPQGWGPFFGPWTPLDFVDPASGISDGYDGSNAWEFAPDYDIITLFSDRSLDFVWNTSYAVAAGNQEAEQEQGYTSTIANVVPHKTNLIGRLRAAIAAGGSQ